MSDNVTIDISHEPNTLYNDGNGKYTYIYYDEEVLITVTEYIEPKDFPGYKVRIHKPPNGYTISKIKGAPNNGPPGQVSCSTVSVISWLGDSNHNTPLAVQLGHDGEYYTNTKGDNNWTKSGSKNPGDILKELDFWVCKNREAHIINLSEEGGAWNTDNRYHCPSCSEKRITVTKSQPPSMDCTLYVHEVIRGSISRFKDSQTNYSGLSNIGGVKSVNVYCTKNTTNALLIYFKSNNGGVLLENKWYSRCSGDTHWEVENALNGEQPGNNIAKIKGILDDSLVPKVIIDLSNPAGQYIAHRTTLSLNVSQEHFRDSSFLKLKHQKSDNGNFKIKSVVHEEKTLVGISSNVLLSSVSAFYFGQDTSEKHLLMVELAYSDNTKHSYYRRGFVNRNEWKEEFQHMRKIKITEDDIVKSLNVLKRIEFPRPPSNTGKIIETCLITSDVLAGGGLVGLGIWKGPGIVRSIISLLITRI